MDEKLMHRRLRRTAVIIVLISLALILLEGTATHSLQKNLNDTIEQRITTEVQQYKSIILDQIDANLKSLNTLASYIEQMDFEDEEDFARRIDEANKSNDFISMIFIGRDGLNILSTLGKKVQIGFDQEQVSEEVSQLIDKNFQGEQGVSQMYPSQVVEADVFVYGVPVYDDQDQIIGSLLASDNIDLFFRPLSDPNVLNGAGILHLLSGDGTFLIRSPQSVVREEMDSIFDGPYWKGDEKEEAQVALQNQQSFFSSFEYDGNTYQFLLEPIGINGWYLFCQNTPQSLSGEIYSMVRFMQLIFFIVLLMFASLMFYGYRSLRRHNRELRRLAYHDQLTGADNMVRFKQKLQTQIEQGNGFSVVAFNVRRFKFINELFGKEQADLLLKYISKVFERHIRDGEFFCRDAADSFYVCLHETDNRHILDWIRSFMAEIGQTTEKYNSNYRVVLYCGIELGTTDNCPVEQILTHALFALEHAKNAHSEQIIFYDSQLQQKQELENQIESRMHAALKNGEFRMFLQPKVSLADGRLSGAEALVRWVNGSGQMFYPDQFIPLFERDGFCVQLDIYMVEQACRQIRSWMDQGIQPIPISVNQSRMLFFTLDYLDRLTELLKKYQVDAGMITLEVLEGIALENVDQLNQRIEQLHELGFKVSMDDFGSGYSSLNTLAKLNIDELKLDRAFLMEISGGSGERTRMIMEQITEMVHHLGISTVVEGVETEENDRMIHEMGCDFGQGYYYSRPIPAQEFSERFMQGR